MKSLDDEIKERFFPGGSTSQFVIELTDFAQAVFKKCKGFAVNSAELA